MGEQDIVNALNNLVKDPTYSAYSAAANTIDRIEPNACGLPALKVAILRNFTLDPMIPVIKGEIGLAGFFPIIYTSDYDAVARDVFDSKSALYRFQPDMVILAQWLEALSPALAARFQSLSFSGANDEAERILNVVVDFITALRQKINAPVLVNNFPLPLYPAYGIMDAQSEDYQINTILKLNLELPRRLRSIKDIYIVDYMSLMARIGSENGHDERYWQIGRAPIGRKVILPFGREYGKFFRALRGKARKCLVLDCDNVLWGGVVGEDGLKGIKIGSAYPGSCYQVFQNEILNLHDRGVILALCSKNNEDDVLEVLRNHPDMVLRENNFSTWQINWDDKVLNLTRIAQDLNIGMDCLVFVDDNQFECDLVREKLPQVEVLQLSSEPSTFRARLNAQAYFDTLVFSAEDRERNRMYRDQIKRQQLCVSAGSLEDYLAKLEMSVEIGLADSSVIPRIAQLTQKTNQFNLTTRRYTEGDIISFTGNPDSDVFYMRLSDRVSDMGVIGAAIVKYENKQADIDTFLLSCRVIGRGVEEAFLAYIINHAKDKGCVCISGRYIATKKNGQVSNFFCRRGFSLKVERDDGSDWELLVDGRAFSGPAWIKIGQIESRDKICKLMKRN